MNPLNDNPKARKVTYQVFWFAALVVGAFNVGMLASGGPDSLPTWLVVTNAVLPFIGTGIGYQASQNTSANN